MTVRAICRTIGVEGHDPEDPLGPILPPVVQVNAEEGAVAPGDIVTIRVRVRVEQLVPAPLRPGDTA